MNAALCGVLPAAEIPLRSPGEVWEAAAWPDTSHARLHILAAYRLAGYRQQPIPAVDKLQGYIFLLEEREEVAQGVGKNPVQKQWRHLRTVWKKGLVRQGLTTSGWFGWECVLPPVLPNFRPNRDEGECKVIQGAYLFTEEKWQRDQAIFNARTFAGSLKGEAMKKMVKSPRKPKPSAEGRKKPYEDDSDAQMRERDLDMWGELSEADKRLAVR